MRVCVCVLFRYMFYVSFFRVLYQALQFNGVCVYVLTTTVVLFFQNPVFFFKI